MSVPELTQAGRDLPTPCAVLDLAALRSNADDLVRRADGLPIRVATKSVRCRAVLELVLARPGFAGALAYSLREALWLAHHGIDDILLAYPTVDRAAIDELAEPVAARAITVMVDHPRQLDLLARAAAPGCPIRVCLDVDASLRLGPIHLGVRRSPVHSVDQAVRAAEWIRGRTGVRLAGLMFYDAQIAGLPDASPAVRLVKKVSARELISRRAAVVGAVQEVCGRPLELVNGGGTGSLHVTGRDPHLTELAAGSGLYGPTLFDAYRDFTPTPAVFLVLPVVRRPSPTIATVYSGGYIASGPPGWSRVPRPVWPEGLRLLRAEGAGEVQTPVQGSGAAHLAIGDQVWFRHAKAGELCERVDQLHVVDGEQIVATVPTYRGEGQNFG